MRLFPTQDETIAGTAKALRAGRLTCVDILRRCLAQIEEWEPQVHAWVLVDRERALERARQLDAELAAGTDRGPLHGIPIGIKDIIDVEGLPTVAGYPPWTGRIAEKDATLVTRLRLAGAVILGKTVTTTFAWIDPPVTRNPWNLERTPGGSSSGSAAAVACGMCLGALGTQTGGSITRPAAFCGIVGHKPSFGALPTEGIVPFSRSLDTPGPMARTVEDVLLLQRALRLYDAQPDNVPFQPIAPRRIGRLGDFYRERSDPAMNEAMDQTLARFAAWGVEVVEVRSSSNRLDIHRCHRLVMASEAARVHPQELGTNLQDYPSQIRSLIEEASQIDPDDAKAALQMVSIFRHNCGTPSVAGAPVDLIAVPSARGGAPDRSTTGDPIFNSPWTLVGLPTVTIPIGLDPEGMPLGIQLVGRRSVASVLHEGLMSLPLGVQYIGPLQAPDDETFFRHAAWCEREIRRNLGFDSISRF